MKQALAYFLSVLLLLQSFGREMLVAHYELNKARITAQYCVNKARPQLRCNGKCHLMRQIRLTEGSDKKLPIGSVVKVKFEGLPTPDRLPFQAPHRWPAAAHSYAPLPGVRYIDAPVAGVFRPPLLLV